MKSWISVLVVFLCLNTNAQNQKPKVWIYTDMTDSSLPGQNKEGTINDPDDISAMAGYLLMANEFETMGIVVGSTHRKEHANTPDQGDWANEFFGKAYAKDVMGLNKNIGGYPEKIHFVQSSIKETAERFDPQKEYTSLENYNTVTALLKLAETEEDTINVLIWGSTTEPAILVSHALETGQKEVLKKLRFIAHWTNSPLHQGSREHPENVANCREDAQACAYLKKMAFDGHIEYYECGAIGQHGIVSGGPKGKAYFNQFEASALGTIFINGKYVHDGVDHSDSATYWVLLGEYGVGLKDINSNGTNSAEIEKRNEDKFRKKSKEIHDELLTRSKLAFGDN